jgi:toxin ParE1/3/4
VKIEWLPAARKNRESQIAYLTHRNPRAALRMDEAIEAAVTGLSEQPHSGRLGRLGGTRELVVAGTPSMIAYRVEGSAVVILRLMHGAQRWPDQI